MVAPDPSRAAARRSLLQWYRRRSRALPWRQSKSPYTVWVSEIMLQQTQIDSVIPYYERFLREFPTVERLAKASLERVLELWSGLGYYRRARNLHRAAQELVEIHRGQFPRDMKLARSLPGVGDYTARAVLSIAYNQPFAVMDGNVARVMARFMALRGNLHQPQFRQAIEENLNLLLSRRSPGDFNQALMELGQTTCLPRSPQCAICPLKKWCKGFELHNPEDFPEPRPRRQAEQWHMAAAVLRQGNKVLLCRGLDDGLLDDLWNFPAALGKSGTEAIALLKQKLGSVPGAPGTLQKFAHQLRHNITYRSIQVRIYKGEFKGNVAGEGFRWFQPQSIERAAVSQLARKIARKIGEAGDEPRRA
jgi:A/G-specific adenine glycosylase